MEFVITVLPRFLALITVSSVGAVSAGLILYGYITRIATALAPSRSGFPLIDAGAGFGLIALVIALGIVVPTGRKLVSTLINKPPSLGSEAPKLPKRLRIAASSATGILFLALILMLIGASI